MNSFFHNISKLCQLLNIIKGTSGTQQASFRVQFQSTSHQDLLHLAPFHAERHRGLIVCDYNHLKGNRGATNFH